MAVVYQCDNCKKVEESDSGMFTVEPPEIQTMGKAYDEMLFCSPACIGLYFTRGAKIEENVDR